MVSETTLIAGEIALLLITLATCMELLSMRASLNALRRRAEEKVGELERLSDRLNSELEKFQYESLKVMQNTRNEAVKLFGRAGSLIQEAREVLKELEEKTVEAEKRLDWRVAETEKRLKDAEEEILAVQNSLAGIREEVGKIHLALLDFDKRIKETEKNVREAEEIALGVLTRIEEVLESAEERPAEGYRDKAEGGRRGP